MAWNTHPTYGPIETAFAEPRYLPVVADVGSLSASYTQDIGSAVGLGIYARMPAPPVPPPSSALGQFTLGSAPLGGPPAPSGGPGSPLPLAVIDDRFRGNTRYVPAWAPDGRIGRFVIGRSPIGYQDHRTHHTVEVGPPLALAWTELPT
jgi:hypothetical protein